MWKVGRMFDAVTIAFMTTVTGVITILAAHRLRLSRWRTVEASLAVVALTVLIATEQDVEIGEWWAKHPNTGAFVSGVLLLTLTVLIVERAGVWSLARAEEQRWRSAGTVAAGSVLDAVTVRMKPQQEALWEHGAIASNPEANRTDGVESMSHASAGFAQEIRSAVLDTAPVLTATPGLYEIYRPALRAVQAAAQYEADMRLWAIAARLPDDPGSGASASDAEIHEHWWDVMTDPWTEFRNAMRDFAHHAEVELGARTTDWDLAPWLDDGPADFRERLELEYQKREPTEADFM